MGMKNLELIVGAFILMGGMALAFLALEVSGLSHQSSEQTYRIHAHFDNVGGLTVRAKVTMAGVIIGRVADIHLDQKTFSAVVEMDILKSVNHISRDSTAAILTAGLLGEKYIGISQGADEELLTEDSWIEDTQPALVLEELIGKFLFNKLNTPSNTQH